MARSRNLLGETYAPVFNDITITPYYAVQHPEFHQLSSNMMDRDYIPIGSLEAPGVVSASDTEKGGVYGQTSGVSQATSY